MTSKVHCWDEVWRAVDEAGVEKAYNDPSYFPVYERANEYGWVVMFHTGIVLRAKFTEPENVASGRMRPIYIEEIARRQPTHQ